MCFSWIRLCECNNVSASSNLTWLIWAYEVMVQCRLIFHNCFCLDVVFFSKEVDLNDPSTQGEPHDYRFVKWLIKEKVIRGERFRLN